MALGHSTIPDDWDVYSRDNGSGVLLPYNPVLKGAVPEFTNGPPALANHGNQQLRFGPQSANGFDTAHKFLHKATTLASAGSQSSRVFTASAGLYTSDQYAYPVVRADETPASVVNSYRAAIVGNAGQAYLNLTGGRDVGGAFSMAQSSYSLLLNFTELPADWKQFGPSKWYGVRLDAQTIGSSVLLEVFICTTHARIEQALVDEAAWLKVMRCWHQPDNSCVNEPQLGMAYSVSTFAGGPRLTGRAGFAVVKNPFATANAIGFAASPHAISL